MPLVVRYAIFYLPSQKEIKNFGNYNCKTPPVARYIGISEIFKMGGGGVPLKPMNYSKELD